MSDTPPRLRRADAAAYLLRRHGMTVAVSTLAAFATRGGGPRYQKAGRVPLYPTVELDRWAEGRLGDLIEHSSARA